MPFRFPRYIFLISGKTGAGKSRLLSLLGAAGEPVLHLEELAGHRGSAFGANGLNLPSPSQPKFEEAVQRNLAAFDHPAYIITEQKGRNLGKLQLPEYIRNPAGTTYVIELHTDDAQRIAHLEQDYFTHPDCFKEAEKSLLTLKEKMPAALWYAANEFLRGREIEAFLKTMLNYYDNGDRYRSAAKAELSIPIQQEEDLIQAVHEVRRLAARLTVPA